MKSIERQRLKQFHCCKSLRSSAENWAAKRSQRCLKDFSGLDYTLGNGLWLDLCIETWLMLWELTLCFGTWLINETLTFNCLKTFFKLFPTTSGICPQTVKKVFLSCCWWHTMTPITSFNLTIIAGFSDEKLRGSRQSSVFPLINRPTIYCRLLIAEMNRGSARHWHSTQNRNVQRPTRNRVKVRGTGFKTQLIFKFTSSSLFSHTRARLCVPSSS